MMYAMNILYSVFEAHIAAAELEIIYTNRPQVWLH